jgi:hypothetical protein
MTVRMAEAEDRVLIHESDSGEGGRLMQWVMWREADRRSTLL